MGIGITREQESRYEVSAMKDIFPRTFFPTECISYPRSGHHALVDVLQNYFGGGFHYCEIYRDHRPEELLGAEGSITNYQKNHDFKLDTPILTDRQYLVQVRNPLESIESWNELDRRVGHVPDSEENRLDFWVAFVKKWLLTPISNRLVVYYQDLIESPLPTCVSILQFLTKTQNVDVPLLEQSLKQFPFVRRRENRPTRYLKT